MKSKNVLLLIILALCWGPSFFFIKVILEAIPTFTLVSLRLGIASLVLYLIIKVQKKKLLPFFKYWKHFIVMGFFASACPFVLITYSEISMPSSLAGIVNGSPPIFTAVLAHYFLDTEKMRLRKFSGILIGFIGIIIVFLPSLFEGLQGHAMGIFYVIIASLCYSIGMVYSRKHLSGLPNLIGPFFQVFMGTLLVLPFSIFIEHPQTLAFPSLKIISSLLGLSLLGTVLAFAIYYTIMRNAGATYLSTATLLFPFVSIFLGVIFLKERLKWNDYVGCGIILLGLVITNALITFRDIISIFKVKKIQQEEKNK